MLIKTSRGRFNSETLRYLSKGQNKSGSIFYVEATELPVRRIVEEFSGENARERRDQFWNDLNAKLQSPVPSAAKRVLKCRLGEILKGRGITQTMFGSDSGLKQACLSKICNGKYVPSGNVLVILCETLECEISDLLQLCYENNSPDVLE